MTSLTRTAIIARKAIRYTIIGLVVLIIGRVVLINSIGIYRKFFPKPPPPPTISFGKLPKLPFPEKQPASLQFSIETPEGGLPVLPTQMKVYFMPGTAANLLSLDTAKQKASSLGFTPDAHEKSDTVYTFNNKRSAAVLEMNIVTGAFSVSYDLKSDSSPLENRPPAPEIAAGAVRSFLSAGNLLPKDLTGRMVHEFLAQDGDKFITTISLSEADLVKINLFRKDFEKYPSLTSNPTESNVWFIVSGAREREKQIVAGQYHYLPVDETKFSTYPIKTSEVAWEELKSGQAYIASQGSNQNSVVIRRVYLGYFDPASFTQFYQPIIVFEGDNGFVAYIPAVTVDYYGE